jgi:predicted Rossmann fold flavoprotein
MKIYDVIVLGAGASGLMLAANLGKKLTTAIVDTNVKAARKVKISGGGKCNITNIEVSTHNYDGESRLLESVFKRFGQQKLLNYLSRNNIELELRKGRYYFCKRSSDDIINLLLHDARASTLLLGYTLKAVKKENEFFCVQTDKENLYANKVVVATGGESFKNLGATDIGLEIAKNFGIKYKKFTPALVGLTLQREQFWMKELSGLSCEVAISVGEKYLQEEMLFAHKGISGPAVLSASLYWKKGDISIDFLPEKSVRVLVKEGKNRLLSTALPLPKRLAKELIKAVGLNDKECKSLQEHELIHLENIHNYTFAPAGNFGFSKAEVSRGGVIADELSFTTLESKKVEGLYFIGEVVDVTGELGGYNFQWAFASGFVAAQALKQSLASLK